MPALVSRKVDDVLILGFSDGKILDETAMRAVSDALLAAANESKKDDRILLSFQGVGFMSSSMIGKLVAFMKKCKSTGARLKLCSISPAIMEIFKITKLNKTFDICKDEKTAIEEFSKKSWFRG